jgi:cobaltochelatase CobS
MTGTFMTIDTTIPAAVADSRIKCAICGALVHSIQHHLPREHADIAMTLEQYQEKFPGEPILSDLAERKIADLTKARAEAAGKASVSADSPDNAGNSKQLLHELFSLGTGAAVMSSSGRPISITVLGKNETFNDLIPDIDPNYLFNVDILKTLMMGIEMNMAVYLWGHAGTGKTTIFEQIAARTKRPFFRVQHTANMEEEHIVGGWRLRDGRTHFELGPLAMAMKFGWLYMADEYDFGRPEVTSVYQAVLEGKPLVIKEADHDNRVIRPHPDFRICGTGNTNGQGDESGLYQGTNIQNAANYERFGVVEQMPYMDKKLESRLISQQANIPLKDAEKLVDFATRIRAEFDGGKIGNPISPRSLIFAAKIGVARSNYRIGLEKSFINRLSSTDRESASQVAQRVFA